MKADTEIISIEPARTDCQENPDWDPPVTSHLW